MWKNVVAPVMLVMVFWVLSSLITARYIHHLESVPERMLVEDASTIHAATAMRSAMGKLNRLLATSPRPYSQDVAKRAAAFQEEFLKNARAALATATTPREPHLNQEIMARFREHQKEVERQLHQDPTGDEDLAADLTRLMQLSGAIVEKENELAAVNEEAMRALATSRPASAVLLERVRYLLLIAGPIAGILCGFWVSRRFHRSISKISVTLSGVASEMTQDVGRVDVHQVGELPYLQEQVNMVVSRIRDVVQKLDEARRRAVDSARLAALGEMAAGVAHELRNPLTSVKLLIQTSAGRNNRSLTEKQFEVVLSEISRMETTIERMLDFARPPRMVRTCHDLRSTLQRAMNLVEARAQHVGVCIQTQWPDCPCLVDGDVEQLYQVFINVLQNAIEAMLEGGQLVISTQSASASSVWQIQFSDTGPGISHEVMDRIFEPFVTDKTRGTGLGLAVSYRIIIDHGGKMLACNREGGGAVFTIELPQADSAASSPVVVEPKADPVLPALLPEAAYAQAAHPG